MQWIDRRSLQRTFLLHFFQGRKQKHVISPFKIIPREIVRKTFLVVEYELIKELLRENLQYSLNMGLS